MQKSCVGCLSLRLLTAGILTACASSTMAAGFALIEQSASQMGNAFAGGAAFANDASTIFFNPAGMTRLPRQFVGGLHAVKTSAKFDGSANDPAGFPMSGGNGGDAGTTGLVPNLYLSTPVTDNLFVGLGINAPFGLSTEYNDDWKGRYQALKSELVTINFNPSIAYRVNNRFSFGVGVNIQYIDAELTQNIDQGSLCVPTYDALAAAGVPVPPSAVACAGLVPQGSDAFAKVTGNNWGGGLNAGILYEPTSSTRIGLSYRSQIEQQLIGNARFRGTLPQFSAVNIFTRTNVSAGVTLPRSASLSAWHDINNQWSVMADATWTDWTSFDELRIKYDSFQPDTAIDENWDDVWRLSFGADYRYNSNWTFRAGVAYDQSPIPDSQHRTARIPGEDRLWTSVGFGYQINEAVGIDVGYSHLFIDDPEINESSPTTGSLNGEYDADVDILSAQVVWNI